MKSDVKAENMHYFCLKTKTADNSKQIWIGSNHSAGNSEFDYN